ncbi:hypothetical protein BDP81DRAFT_454429 [Colletotrichum phormii]|uniref:Clock-controlled pheromone ccg-4 n=1 Tax=Colletotrichum phormii TaxID=359342 RepID=A0AAJ0EBF6_9PEZI|nr:uncharacterized protein BDP81DRAFT_454429 [Colletotrichum phormii]KAK1623643.1 hypothetical protein BDP81DRAFT_454429 [Colletotrichum phormii]
MKYLAALAILAITTSAIALPEANPYNHVFTWPGRKTGWCQSVGQGCWKAKEKRAAALKREAVPGKGWCLDINQPCWKTKTEAETDTVTITETTTETQKRDPKAKKPLKYLTTWPGRKQGWCQAVGQGCWKVKRAAETFAVALAKDDLVVDRDSPQALASHARGGAAYTAKRALNELADIVAASQDDPFYYYGGLDIGNHFAADTPEAEAVVARRDVEAEGGWCNSKLIGQPCWKRDVETSGDDVHSGERHWCNRPGAPCAIARRAAEALLDGVVDGEEEGNEAQAAKTEAFCTSHDQDCWTRSADPAAWKASRDLKAMKAAARDLLEAVA